MSQEELPFISIIVPTYNEGLYARSCLAALQQLNYPKNLYEIIVVDNGSTDDTVSICRSVTPYVYVYPGLTVAALRNYGCQIAKGSVLAFIDADCIADPDWLQCAARSLEVDACVTGSTVQIPANGGWIERVWFSQRKKGRSEASHINSANLIVPANLFRELGGFSESLLTGEDYEFSMRAKKITRLIDDESIKVIHLRNPKNFGQFLKREIWHGLGSLGSLRASWFDKALLGTLIFCTMSLSQAAGIVLDGFGITEHLFLYSTAGVCMLLVLTVVYRFVTLDVYDNQRYRNLPAIGGGEQRQPSRHRRQALPDTMGLLVLYYLYYLGRGIGLIKHLARKGAYYRQNNHA